jgi:subfamily B ATP-binding cassette protein MsbA
MFVRGYGGLRAAILIMGLTGLVALLEGFNVGLLVPLLESLGNTDPSSTHWVTRAFARIFASVGLELRLETILVALAVMVLLVSTLKYIKTMMATKTDIGFNIWMRSRLMGNYLRSDISYFHRTELGRMINTLVTQVDHAGGTFFSMTEIVSSVGVTLAYLIAALLISPSLTGIAIGTMAVVTLIMQYFINKARAMGTQIVQAHSDMQADAVDTLSGVRVIKSFQLEDSRTHGFNQRIRDLGVLNYSVDMNRAQAGIVQEVSLFAIIGGIVYVAVNWIGLDLTVTVALLFVLYRMAPRINNLNSIRQALAISFAALHHVKEITDETGSPQIISGSTPFQGIYHSIVLEKVTFSYNGGPDVLHDADFIIEKGKMTALVGTSGAGKSTLIDLVLRFHDPVKGGIVVDGTDLRDLDLADWRRSIGLVSQDVFLFNDTIAKNISFGVEEEDIAEEAVISASKQAYAHDFILKLPDGYDTIVGDRGLNLSGGQRQRVSLARAILKQPKLLILDEATSSLDSESESLIQDYIREIRGSLTILVVAHRMSTIQSADKIAVLEDGRIVEEGDWDSLLAVKGVFANYHRLQFGG